MASVSYSARERRLAFESLCWPQDARGLVDATEAFARPGEALILDLTRMPNLPDAVAVAIRDACRHAEQLGCRIRVWTDPDTPTAARMTPTAGPTQSTAAV